MRGYEIIYLGNKIIGWTAFACKGELRFQLMKHQDKITLQEHAPIRLKEFILNPTTDFQRFQTA